MKKYYRDLFNKKIDNFLNWLTFSEKTDENENLDFENDVPTHKYPMTSNNGFNVYPFQYAYLQDSINTARDLCYGSSFAAGWHSKPREDGTRFMLMVSEIAEAMEGNRKNLMDEHLPHRSSEEVELGDCIIRILDHCGKKNFDIGGAVAEKFIYNQTRADHKLENRVKEGGKAY